MNTPHEARRAHGVPEPIPPDGEPPTEPPPIEPDRPVPLPPDQPPPAPVEPPGPVPGPLGDPTPGGPGGLPDHIITAPPRRPDAAPRRATPAIVGHRLKCNPVPGGAAPTTSRSRVSPWN